MKLHTASIAPNPRVVHMFIAEKGIDIPKVEVDLRNAENRKTPYLAMNPTGGTPTLELDDGSMLSEVTAICDYLEEKYPEPVLIGTTPEERAKTRMWVRRIDLNIVEPMTNGFRFAEGLPMFKDRRHCIPAAAKDLKEIAQEQLTWLNAQMGKNEFITGPKISLADIFLYPFLEFGAAFGQTLNKDNKWIAAWYERMAARPSAKL